MKEKNKTKIIVALISFITLTLSALIGAIWGKSNVSIVVQTDGKNVVLRNNDVQTLVTENDMLKDKISDYESQIATLISQKDELESKLGNANGELSEVPVVEFKDIGLSINGEEFPINKTKSFVSINGNQYYSKDFINALIGEDQSVTTKDGIFYIGKIVAKKAKLTDQIIVDISAGMKKSNNVTDSYGNNYSDALLANYESSAIFNLGGKYSMLKAKIAIREKVPRDTNGYVEIFADDVSVYKSPALDIMTPAFVIDIPINDATLLKISYNCTGYDPDCIIADAVLYNQE